MVLAAYFLWYRKLPLEERKEYEGKPGRRRSTGENSGISFFIGLVWLAIVWIDGKWNLAFEDWTFNDWVYSWLAAGLVVLVIAGIPVLIYVIWAIRRNGT
jgi:fatty acid desaturase